MSNEVGSSCIFLLISLELVLEILTAGDVWWDIKVVGLFSLNCIRSDDEHMDNLKPQINPLGSIKTLTILLFLQV